MKKVILIFISLIVACKSFAQGQYDELHTFGENFYSINKRNEIFESESFKYLMNNLNAFETQELERNLADLIQKRLLTDEISEKCLNQTKEYSTGLLTRKSWALQSKHIIRYLFN